MKTQIEQRDRKYLIIIVLLVIALFLSFKQCESRGVSLAENHNLNLALADSLKVWKDKQGVEYAEKQILQTARVKDFLALKTKDKEIIRLQKEVTKYKDKLGKSGGVTVITGETIIDTFYTQPIVVYKDNVFHKDSIQNKWIDWKYQVVTDTLKNENVIDFKLKLNYEYAVINKEKSNGWFKKPTPYAEVVNYNPYSSTLSVTSYRVINDTKPKRFGIGPVFAYGIGANFTPQFFVGAGVNINLIKF
jgi:hypothetical protein